MPNQTTSHIYKLLKRQPSTSSRISSRTPTCKQVSGNAVQQPSGRLINDITTAFQRKGKFGAGFIDLTDAHDTVWYRGLYLKLLKTLADACQLREIHYSSYSGSIFSHPMGPAAEGFSARSCAFQYLDCRYAPRRQFPIHLCR